MCFSVLHKKERKIVYCIIGFIVACVCLLNFSINNVYSFYFSLCLLLLHLILEKEKKSYYAFVVKSKMWSHFILVRLSIHLVCSNKNRFCFHFVCHEFELQHNIALFAFDKLNVTIWQLMRIRTLILKFDWIVCCYCIFTSWSNNNKMV